jgi:3-dehydroquinate dehydratase type I
MSFCITKSAYNKVCLSLSGRTFFECKAQLDKTPFAELRLDRIEMTAQEISSLVAIANEWIITVKEPFFNNADFIELFKAALKTNIRFVDFDFEIIEKQQTQELLNISKKAGLKIMYSWHDFEKTPDADSLLKKLKEITDKNPDAIKMVCMGNNFNDAEKMLNLYKHYSNIVSFCMGEKCRETRIAALKRGLCFSYAHPDAEESVAPGQYSYTKMISIADLLESGGEIYD